MMNRILAAGLVWLGLSLGAFAQAPPPVPALPDSPRLTSYSISSSTCACSVGFQIYGSGTDVDEWISVYVNGVAKLSTDPTFGWSLASVSPGGLASARPITNAILTFNAAQSGTIVIVGNERPRRLSQFSENRGVTARDLNQAITDAVAVQRELWDKSNRSIVGQPGEIFPALPPVAQRAGQFLCFSALGVPGTCAALSGGGGLSVPTATVNGNVVCWSGTTGTALSDCKVVQAQNAAPMSTVDLQSAVPVNGFYGSGSGAIYQNCPLTGCLAGDHQQSAFYLKATATRDASIAEYMATFDCNLNSGSTGTPAGPGGFSNAKVCFFNSAITGSLSGANTWGMANDLVIGAGDTGLFKVSAEFDIQNNSSDCAIGVKNCYNLYIAGTPINPITAYVALANPTATLGAHMGILVQGTVLADQADIVVQDNASIGLAFGSPFIGSTTHSIASIYDSSTTPVAIKLLGTYSAAAIELPGNAPICFNAAANCISYSVGAGTLTTSSSFQASFLGTGQFTIAGLPACAAGIAGFRVAVTNGVATPTFGATVSTTGAVWSPVVCNGTNWIYG